MAEMTLEDVPAGCGVISKLTPEDGDFRITWKPGKPDEVENAREAFADLRRSGYMLYKVEPGQGGRRTQVARFDPADKLLVAVRANVGG